MIDLRQNTRHSLSSFDLINDHTLKHRSKDLLAHINALCKMPQGCFATDAYFAKQLHTSERTIQRSLSLLKSKGLIQTELKSTWGKYTRKIRLTDKGVDKFFPQTQYFRTPPHVADIISSKNNILSNTSIPPYTVAKKEEKTEVTYNKLNLILSDDELGRNYRYNLVKAWEKEGRSASDFDYAWSRMINNREPIKKPERWLRRVADNRNNPKYNKFNV